MDTGLDDDGTYDDPYRDWYDDWDPFNDIPAKEEPDCPPCGDSGWVMTDRLVPFTGGRHHRMRCPSCNPNRVAVLILRLGLWRIPRRLRYLRDWLRRGGQSRPTSTVTPDEAPF